LQAESEVRPWDPVRAWFGTRVSSLQSMLPAGDTGYQTKPGTGSMDELLTLPARVERMEKRLYGMLDLKGFVTGS